MLISESRKSDILRYIRKDLKNRLLYNSQKELVLNTHLLEKDEYLELLE